MGYFFKQDKASVLGVIFDYGMFDAIVAIVICTTFFDKSAALPAVFISIIQNVTAPILVHCTKSRALKIGSRMLKDDAL